jgi:hypothetical protein
MTDEMQGELFSEEELRLCETHKETSDGSEHLVLADLRNCWVVRAYWTGTVAPGSSESPICSVRGVVDSVYPDWYSRYNGVRKSD